MLQKVLFPLLRCLLELVVAEIEGYLREVIQECWGGEEETFSKSNESLHYTTPRSCS